MPEVYADQPTGTVTSGGTAATTGSQSFTVTANTAFPVASSTAVPATTFRIIDPVLPSEIMLVTTCPGGTGSGQSWTVTRAAEGTAAVAHAANWTCVQVVTQGSLQGYTQLVLAGVSATTVTSTTETVLASYTPLSTDVTAGATFQAIAYGPITAHGGSTRGTLQFCLYWGGSGAVGAAFTSTGSTLLASVLTGTNFPAFVATTVIAGASFDVLCTLTLISTTTANAKMDAWIQGQAAMSTAPMTGTATNTTTKGGGSTSGPISITGSGPVILTGCWPAANYNTQSFTAVSPLISRIA